MHPTKCLWQDLSNIIFIKKVHMNSSACLYTYSRIFTILS